MRGGTTWAASWLDRPDLPGVVTGTVDQIGSRFLFRGYGVSDNRKPIDAALVGTDSLLLIDEAHLAEAMITTIRAAHHRDSNGLNVPPARVVLLTATPPRSQPSPSPTPAAAITQPPVTYRLNAGAHQRDTDQTAWRRLTAPKRLHLLHADKAATEPAIAALALRHTSEPDLDTVLVVCNTVNRARAVYDLILKKTPSSGNTPPTVSLLIGRSRPVDREQVVTDVIERFGAGRDRSVPRPPAILVATQTVEVGADLDASVLISESASWDALIQRFGRLNRFGQHPRGGRAILVHDDVADGPVYGHSRDEAWSYLLERAEATKVTKTADVALVDVDGLNISPLACRELTSTVPRAAIADRDPAALLTRTQLDAWVRTGPVPLNDPPLEAYLHGLSAASPAVSILWRDGLSTDTSFDWTDDDEDDEEASVSAASTMLTAIRPRAEEQIEVPLITARRWMSGETPGVVSDLEYTTDTAETTRHITEAFRALVRRPSDRVKDPSTNQWRWVDADQIRPGDVLVIPTERGGLDEFGWAPAERHLVLDVSEVAALRRGLPLLNLDNRLAWRLGLNAEAAVSIRNNVADLMRRLTSEDPSVTDADDELIEPPSLLIARLLRGTHPSAASTAPDAELERERIDGLAWTRPDISALIVWLETEPSVQVLGDRDDRHREVEPQLILRATPSTHAFAPVAVPEGSTQAVERVVVSQAVADGVERDDDTVAGSSSSVTSTVTLSRHHHNVGRRAAQIAQALGLDEATTSVVQDAARWHDLGKVETRFQTMLHGGDRFLADLAPEPLAKSGIPQSEPGRWRTARVRSELPAGARHEAWSSALIEEYLNTPGVDYPGDQDLLLHLIASHHGRARPLLPPVVDSAPAPISAEVEGLTVTVTSSRVLSLDHPARFEHLNQRYGRWGLALLESIVRCADMTVSGEGS
jgi:CRISPR-associated endonuclease/helicase Cas3